MKLQEVKQILYSIVKEAQEVFGYYSFYIKSLFYRKGDNRMLETFNDVILHNTARLFFIDNNEIRWRFMNIAMDVNCELRGLHYPYRMAVYEVWRPLEVQVDYWLQGRYTEGNVITYALPGQSFHHYNCAMDLVFWNPEEGWTWKKGLHWGIKREIARRYGCQTYRWDSPHVEYRIPEIDEKRKEITRYIVKRMKQEGINWKKKMKGIPKWLRDL